MLSHSCKKWAILILKKIDIVLFHTATEPEKGSVELAATFAGLVFLANPFSSVHRLLYPFPHSPFDYLQALSVRHESLCFPSFNGSRKSPHG